jgi:hypothetical protein
MASPAAGDEYGGSATGPTGPLEDNGAAKSTWATAALVSKSCRRAGNRISLAGTAVHRD